jgi:hypothetical protein
VVIEVASADSLEIGASAMARPVPAQINTQDERTMRLDKRSLLSLVFGLSLVCAASQATAETSVVELFTSQGCSSCPPADRLLKDLSRQPGLIALSFNVDYWDYLGWKDTLAKHAFSNRQRSYARLRGDGAVYTPQVVVNGLTHAIGSVPKQIKAALALTQQKLNGHHVPLTVGTTKEAFTITVGAADKPPAKGATVWLATVRPKVTVKIRHGENRGRTLNYYNVVRSLSAVGMWSGQQTTIKLRQRNFVPDKSMRCVVLVQAEGGAILAATWMPAPK